MMEKSQSLDGYLESGGVHNNVLCRLIFLMNPTSPRSCIRLVCSSSCSLHSEDPLAK